MKSRLILFLLFLSLGKTFGQGHDFINQINRRAIPLEIIFSEDRRNNAGLAKDLFNTLNSFSALGLGEASHGTHEFFVAKAALIKQLISVRHYDRIGLEAPYAEVEDLNQYILYQKGDLPQILKNLRQYTYETKEFADLIRILLVFNKDAKVKVLFYGYDFQSPFKALKNLRLAIQDKQQAVSIVDSLISIFNLSNDAIYSHQFDQGDYNDIVNKSKRLYPYFDKHTDLGIHKTINSYKQFLLLNDPGIWDDSNNKISVLRDSIMAQNVLAQIEAGHAMIVWAHNGHIQKSSNKFSKSMGQYLYEKMNSKYCSIGLSTYQGFYTAYSNSEKGVVSTNPLKIPAPNQVEYSLNQVKYKNYMFRTDHLNAPENIDAHRFLVYGATEDQFQTGNMIDNFNYILFIAKTTGSLNYYVKQE